MGRAGARGVRRRHRHPLARRGNRGIGARYDRLAELPGADAEHARLQHETAAEYISKLIPKHATFFAKIIPEVDILNLIPEVDPVDPGPISEHADEWAKFLTEHAQFIQLFNRTVMEHIEKRFSS